MRILAIGTRMPTWVSDAANEYLKRLPRESSIDCVELPASKRSREAPVSRMSEEASAIERRLKSHEQVVALDVEGDLVSTEAIARSLSQWRRDSASIAFVIGGPDGLHPSLKATAAARWSLGRITLPHPLVRVILAEQLYRAWSINAGHPYHRA